MRPKERQVILGGGVVDPVLHDPVCVAWLPVNNPTSINNERINLMHFGVITVKWNSYWCECQPRVPSTWHTKICLLLKCIVMHVECITRRYYSRLFSISIHTVFIYLFKHSSGALFKGGLVIQTRFCVFSWKKLFCFCVTLYCPPNTPLPPLTFTFSVH